MRYCVGRFVRDSPRMRFIAALAVPFTIIAREPVVEPPTRQTPR